MYRIGDNLSSGPGVLKQHTHFKELSKSLGYIVVFLRSPFRKQMTLNKVAVNKPLLPFSLTLQMHQRYFVLFFLIYLSIYLFILY